jgi:hypothetical protein
MDNSLRNYISKEKEWKIKKIKNETKKYDGITSNESIYSLNIMKNYENEPKKEITMELTNYKYHRHKEKYMNAFKNYIIYKSILGK